MDQIFFDNCSTVSRKLEWGFRVVTILRACGLFSE
jgi:hypothetical protein